MILLIDEYDVPLDKAQQYGYYDETLGLIRGIPGKALKTNESLQFAVLSGCLRVAKESIFTGLNNMQVMTITDSLFDGYFGFKDGEVKELLEYYGLEEKYDLIKEWYDGYHFGNTDVYRPWDVLNYCVRLRADINALPKAFWINTGGNDIIRTFLRMAKGTVRREIGELIEGGTVVKKIKEELTYRDMYNSIDNLWSILFTTGYLTRRVDAAEEDGVYRLAIPNLEIRKIFIEQVMEWIQEEARKDTPKLDAFCDAFPKGDTETIEALFTAFLKKTISIRDTSVRKEKKENFYHGVLLGLLSHREEWDIRSNAESGDGFSDILIEIEEAETGIIIEVKYPDNSSLESGCAKALKQIEEKDYEAKLRRDGMTVIFKYGIACERKRCMVKGGN